jgi:hypothetical protein
MNKFTLEIDYDIMDEITRQNLKSAYHHAEDEGVHSSGLISIATESNISCWTAP